MLDMIIPDKEEIVWRRRTPHIGRRHINTRIWGTHAVGIENRNLFFGAGGWG